VGDLVFLKLQPYIQSSLAPRSNQKLAFKFFGPYTVIQKVGLVAYMLDLPTTSAIHPVFHVSQLNKVVGSNVQVSSQCPPEMNAFHVPEKILNRRLVNIGTRTVLQGLIKWSSVLDSLATWEDLSR
jgi:hypothetical protein